MRISNYSRTANNPGIKVTISGVHLLNNFSNLAAIGVNANYPKEMAQIVSRTADNEFLITTTETFGNSGGDNLLLTVTQAII